MGAAHLHESIGLGPDCVGDSTSHPVFGELLVMTHERHEQFTAVFGRHGRGGQGGVEEVRGDRTGSVLEQDRDVLREDTRS
jgi:hypothetical protein